MEGGYCPRSPGKEEAIFQKVQVASNPRGRCCPFLVIREEGQKTTTGDGIRKEKRVTRPAVGEGKGGGGPSSAALLVEEIGDQSWWMT